jgi:hypothetical protein
MSQATLGHISALSPGKSVFNEAGVLLGTPILTLDGALPVEFLAPGDRVLTRSGMRRLASIEVTTVQNARVVHIARDSLGLGRPRAQITVSPAQEVHLRDWRAKALFGKSEAPIRAERLADGEFVRADILAEARFFTLRFDACEIIYAGGVELACSPAMATA